MAFSEHQARIFRQRLLRLNPPAEVIQKFDELVAIVHSFGTEDEIEDVLKDACRRENWTRPWEPPGIRLTFRAKKIDYRHSEHSYDCGGENTPATEQAYRRGVVHGIGHAMREVGVSFGSEHPLAQEQLRVWKWRSAELHDRAGTWGFIEPEYPCTIRTTLRRSGLPPRLRWNILKRDGYRCTVCGASANDGAIIEVDHIITVADGGSDDPSNLQTLCFDCNRGKGSESQDDATD